MKNIIIMDSVEFIGGKEIRILISPFGKELIKIVIVFVGLVLLMLVWWLSL